MLELGKSGRDKVTGFEGIITARCTFLYGCDRYCLTPKVDKDGKTGDGEYFDEGRIEIVGDGIQPKDVRAEKNGGDSNPKKRMDAPTN